MEERARRADLQGNSYPGSANLPKQIHDQAHPLLCSPVVVRLPWQFPGTSFASRVEAEGGRCFGPPSTRLFGLHPRS